MTGTFDNWSKTLPLVKRPDGSFELEVPLAKGTEKIEFKFVLNGDEWVTSDTYWTVVDETGNTNNYIEFAKDGSVVKAEKNMGKTEFGKTENGKTTQPAIIPESGLSMGSAAPAAGAGAAAGAAVLAHGKKEPEEVKPTVMPSQEGVQTTLGEPGVVVPENPQEISAFKEVRNVDAKKLNADIKEQEAAAAAAPGSAASSEGKAKYVKKVKKLVSPEEANKAEADASAGATADAKETPASAGTASTTATGTASTAASKDKGKSPAKKDTAPSTAASSKTASSAKKEKRGFFSRVKKALS